MSGDSLGSTPLDFSGVVGGEAVAESAEHLPSQGQWTCPTCRKVLKTRVGFRKHLLTHRLKDVSLSFHESLQVILHPCMIQVLEQVMKEPSPDNEFRAIGELIIRSSDSYKFSNFLLEVSSSIIEIVVDRKSVMLNHFVEESQTLFFQMLSDNTYFNNVKDYLLIILLPTIFKDEVLNPLLFRICSLYFESIMAETLKLLKTPSREDEDCVLSAKEKSGLLQQSRKVLQGLLEAGLNEDSTKVICSRFVDPPVLKKDFLDTQLWFTSQLCFSDTAATFFENLECVMKKFLRDGSPILPDNIWEFVIKPGRGGFILDYISSLTRGILSESDTIDLFTDIFKCYGFMSGNLEAKAIKASYDAQGNLTVVALRTNLKRNPTQPKS